jgi:hypothetical protein
MGFMTPDKLRPLGVVALAVLLGGCLGNTYGTGVSSGRQTLSDLTGLVSLRAKEKQPISYAPRPPIVAPPTTAELPKPGSAAAPADWPQDPDQLAQQKKLAEANQHYQDPTVAEVTADPGFRLPKSGESTIQYHNDDPNSAKNQIFQMQQAKGEAKQLLAKAKSGAAGQVDANGNPIRTTLTEPPAEYRVPDPASPEEFKAAENEKWWQVFGRRGATTDRVPDTSLEPLSN